MTCLNNGNCLINVHTRKSCTQCRLRKCLFIGMRRMTFRCKRKKQDNDLKITIQNQTVLQKNESNCERFIIARIRHWLQMVSDGLISTSESIEPTISQVNVTKDISNNDNDKLELNRWECYHLSHVQKSISVFIDENRVQTVVNLNDYAKHTFNIPALYATRIVQFCNNFQTFKELPKKQQLNILKPFYVELLAIRIAFLFDQKRNGFFMMENESGNRVIFIQNSLFNTPRTSRPNVISISNIIRQIKFEMEDDPIIRDLLITISLFKPRDNLHNRYREVIGYKYYQYTNLLRRYLENKHQSLMKAKEKLTRIIHLINDLPYIYHDYRRRLLEVGYENVNQVLAEVFELTNQ